MRARLLACVVALAAAVACLNFEQIADQRCADLGLPGCTDGGATDGGGDGGSTTDGGSDGDAGDGYFHGTCISSFLNGLYSSTSIGSWSQDLTTLSPLNGTAGVDYQPTLSADQRKACFVSTRNGNADIFCGFRASALSAFTAAVEQTAVNSTYSDIYPELSPDGSRLFFASDRDGSFKIYQATFNGIAFVAPALVPALNFKGRMLGPSFDCSGEHIYFSASSATIDNFDLYTARTRADFSFDPPTPATGLNISDLEYRATLSPDGQTALVFAQDRDGGVLMRLAWSPGGWQPVSYDRSIPSAVEFGPDHSIYYGDGSPSHLVGKAPLP